MSHLDTIHAATYLAFSAADITAWAADVNVTPANKARAAAAAAHWAAACEAARACEIAIDAGDMAAAAAAASTATSEARAAHKVAAPVRRSIKRDAAIRATVFAAANRSMVA